MKTDLICCDSWADCAVMSHRTTNQRLSGASYSSAVSSATCAADYVDSFVDEESCACKTNHKVVHTNTLPIKFSYHQESEIIHIPTHTPKKRTLKLRKYWMTCTFFTLHHLLTTSARKMESVDVNGKVYTLLNKISRLEEKSEDFWPLLALVDCRQVSWALKYEKKKQEQDRELVIYLKQHLNSKRLFINRIKVKYLNLKNPFHVTFFQVFIPPWPPNGKSKKDLSFNVVGLLSCISKVFLKALL